jgi:membrane protease YdiL (CAAX protease family)
MFDPAFEPALWHLIVAGVILLVLPVFTALVAVPKVRKLPAHEQDKIRPRLYVEAIVLQWALLLIALSPLLFRDVPARQLGLIVEPQQWPRVLLGAAVATLALAGIWWQRHQLMLKPEGPALARDALKDLRWILPRGRVQRGIWVVVSAHAGLCEELFFRGFLFAILNWYMPMWAAALVSIVLFGLGHLYQGAKGVIGTAIVGAVMLALYAFTGSLWVSILLHAVYDFMGGEFGRRVLYGRDASA